MIDMREEYIHRFLQSSESEERKKEVFSPVFFAFKEAAECAERLMASDPEFKAAIQCLGGLDQIKSIISELEASVYETGKEIPLENISILYSFFSSVNQATSNLRRLRNEELKMADQSKNEALMRPWVFLNSAISFAAKAALLYIVIRIILEMIR